MFFLLALVSNIIFSSTHQFLRVQTNGSSYMVVEDDSQKLVFKDRSASKVIQFAIDMTGRDENRILLGSGIFEIENPLKLKNNTVLEGRMRGTELRLTKNNPVAMELRNVLDVTIKNITITTGKNGNSYSAISLKECSGCILNDIIIAGFAKYGIYLEKENTNLVIERCTFVENWQAHIFFNGVSGDKDTPIVIKDNTFIRGGFGTKTINSNVNSRGLNFEDNICFYTRSSIFDSDYNAVNFSGNRSYWGESDVIIIKGDDFLITGNSMSWNRGHSLVLDGAKNGKVIGNNFTDQGARSRDGDLKCGIFMRDAHNITVNACSIWNFGDQGHMEYAIYEEATSSNNIISSNAAWFHAHENAFALYGKNTEANDNNSNTGTYRGDWWDFTQKYGSTADKFLNQYLIPYDIPLPEPENVAPMIDVAVMIESMEQPGQVIETTGNEIIKFGWKDVEAQHWKVEKNNGGYSIRNYEDKLLGVATTNGTFTPIVKNHDKENTGLWDIVSTGNGCFKIVHKPTGLVLDGEGLSNYSWGINKVNYLGEKIKLTEFKYKKSQMWRFEKPTPVYLVNNGL